MEYDTKWPKLPESASWTRTKIILRTIGDLLVLFFFIKQKSKIQACIDRHVVWKVNSYLQVAFCLETAIWLQHFENYARERQFALIQPLVSPWQWQPRLMGIVVVYFLEPAKTWFLWLKVDDCHDSDIIRDCPLFLCLATLRCSDKNILWENRRTKKHIWNHLSRNNWTLFLKD